MDATPATTTADRYFHAGVPIPPSFGDDQMFYAVSVFGLLTITLLCLEWLWRTTWSFYEKPRPFKHPLTVSRLLIFFMLISVLSRAAPDVILLMAWPEISPEWRLWWAQADRAMDGFSAMPMLLAWGIGLLGGPMIDWQMGRMPIPIHLWPSWNQVRRPLRIGALVLGISLAITFLR